MVRRDHSDPSGDDARLVEHGAGIADRGGSLVSLLAGLLTHEFGNALSSIGLALFSVLREPGAADGRVRLRLELAAKELRRLQSDLDGLQELSRADGLQLGSYPPGELFQRALERVHNILGEVPIPVHLLEESREPLELDASRICYALSEMIRFGWQHTGPSGALELSSRLAEGEASICVRGQRATSQSRLDERKIGLFAAGTIATLHGGSLERNFTETSFELKMRIPQPLASP